MNSPEASTAESPPPRTWRFSDVEFDESNAHLRVAGRAVPLAPGTLRLLRVLLHAAPNVVPREELLVKVSNRTSRSVSRNVLSTAVSRLRQALGDEQERLVVAVPGVGYRIAVPVDSRPPPGPPSPPPGASEGDRYVLRVWLDALRGREMLDPSSSVYDALRADIEQVERELADSPLLLVNIHRGMAEHGLANWNPAGAIHHFYRALEITLAAPPDTRPPPELMLTIRFDLCFALAHAIWLEGGTRNLMRARKELAAALPALQQLHEPGAALRMKAGRAAWAVASAGGERAEALRVSEALVAWSFGCAELEPDERAFMQLQHVITMVRAGREKSAVAEIDALVEWVDRHLPAGHMLRIQTRWNQGAIYLLAGRAGDAVVVLEPLPALVAGSTASPGGLIVGIGRWLGLALHAVGRTDDGLAVLRHAHDEAASHRGESSEPALQLLIPMSRLLAALGRSDEALEMLKRGVTPRLRTLAMPGHTFGVLALARWIELLIDTGQGRSAAALLSRLKAEDLRAAVLRPAEAETLLARFAAIER